MQQLKERFSQQPLQFFQAGLLVIALVATSGSLYLSLGLGLIPCELCWYQRILMYPLVPILGYSVYKRELFTPLVLTLSTIGTSIAYYHSYIQIAPSGEHACSSMCTAVLYTVGPFSIPNLSAIAFTMITIGSLIAYYLQKTRGMTM